MHALTISRQSDGASSVFALTSKLATLFARTIHSFPGLPLYHNKHIAGILQNIAKDKAFQRPLERYFYTVIFTPDLILPPDQLQIITSSREGRLAVILLSEPLEQVETAALIMAATMLHRQIIHTTNKAARNHIRTMVGPAAFEVATKEAPVLYAALTSDEYSGFYNDILQAEVEPGRIDLINFGLAPLQAIVASVTPEFTDLISKRFPSSVFKQKPRALFDFTLIMRLLNRRLPQWTRQIG